MSFSIVRQPLLITSQSSKRTVALFVPDLNIGGAEKTIVSLANELALENIPVDLLLMNSEGELLDQVSEGVRIIELFKGTVSTNKLFLLFRSVSGLIHYMNKVRPTVILSSVFGANITTILSSLLTRSDIQVVIREASSLKNYSLIEKLLIKALYFRSKKIIAVSKSGATQLEKFIGAKKGQIEVIHNAVSISKIRALAKRDISLEEFSSKPYIVSVGRLVEAKAFDILIEAFWTCSKLYSQINLVIVGEGPQRTVLENKIEMLGLSDKVILLGEKTNPFPYIKEAELFVLSSRWEGFPNTLLEAMCLGVPIVATDCEFGPKEILSEVRANELVPVDNVEHLTRAINLILSGSSEPIDYSATLSDFSYEKIIKQYSDILS